MHDLQPDSITVTVIFSLKTRQMDRCYGSWGSMPASPIWMQSACWYNPIRCAWSVIWQRCSRD